MQSAVICQAGIAQSVEHFTRNEGVESSSLFSSLKIPEIRRKRISGIFMP